MRSSFLIVLLAATACVGDSSVPNDAGQDAQADATTDSGADVTTDVAIDVAPEASPCPACDGGCFENVCNGGAIVEVSSGGRHTCAVLASGSVWCWGANDFGQSGAASVATIAPTEVAGLSHVVHVSAGTNHTCSVDASGAVYCWGANDQDQLGHDPAGDGKCGGTTCSPVPAKIVSTDVFQSVSAGGNFSCAVNTVGTAYCWGANGAGQLGIGSNTSTFTPSQITTLGPNVQSVSAGTGTGLASGRGFHACAVKTDGSVWCWGANDYNQLGFSGSTSCTDANPCSSAPVAVTLSGKASAAVAANAATCVLMSDGSVQCFGANYLAQLGDGNKAGPNGPTTVTSLTKVIMSLTAGANGTCARAADGTTWCWGISQDGELGNGMTGASTCGVTMIPCQPTPLTAIGAYAKLSRGGATVIGVKADGSLWGWGSNATAQLGVTDAGASSLTPIPVGGVP